LFFRGCKRFRPGVILVIFIIFMAGCSGVKDYLNKSPIGSSIMRKKLTFQKVAEIRVPDKPWGIALNPESAQAYVVCNKDDLVCVVDLTTREITSKIKVGNSPWEAAFDKRRNRLYVTNADDGTISVVDLENKKETLKVSTEKELPFDVIYCENQDEIYVANSDSDCISIIDAEKLTLKQNVECGDYPYSLGIDESTRKIYSSNNFDGTISIIDPIRGVEEKRLNPEGGNLSGLTVDSKNGRTFVAATTSNQILVIDNARANVSGAFRTPDIPLDVCIDDEHKYLYSIHRDLGILAVFSPHGKDPLSKIKVGKSPVRVAIDPIHKLLITVNNESNSISLIRYKVESSR